MDAQVKFLFQNAILLFELKLKECQTDEDIMACEDRIDKIITVYQPTIENKEERDMFNKTIARMRSMVTEKSLEINGEEYGD